MLYELQIKIRDRDYLDDLIVSLARQGFAPYISEDNDKLCINVYDSDLIEVKY